jgi:mRNA interferase MazF
MNRRRAEDDPRRGEVWSVDLGITAKHRPAIIISRNDPDAPRRLTTYIPVTGSFHGSRYEVELPPLSFLDKGSAANLQGIASGESADPGLFVRKLGQLPPDVLAKIEQALLYAAGMAD